jgi:hypothetical protein
MPRRKTVQGRVLSPAAICDRERDAVKAKNSNLRDVTTEMELIAVDRQEFVLGTLQEIAESLGAIAHYLGKAVDKPAE